LDVLNTAVLKNYTIENKKIINNLFQEKKRIVIIGHHNPDGDAIGGSLGLYHCLKTLGHDVSVIMPDAPAVFLMWLPGAEQIFIHKMNALKTGQLIADAEILFCIDFNHPERVEALKMSLIETKAIKILIDHHPNPDVNAEFIFSDTDYSSASEMVFDFISESGIKQGMNKNTAVCLYTGIMTDTLNFSVNSSRSETFKIVSELLTYNIEKEEIYNKVYNNFSVERLKLVGYLLYRKMKLIKEHNFSYIIFTKEEMKEFNFKEGDQEGIVNMPLSVSDIHTSVIAIENNGFVKLSLRSKGETDVNLLARKYFNGGGHKNAAGGKIFKDISAAENYLTESVNSFFKKI
jgi:phosphoesterase RecJ-like protein